MPKNNTLSLSIIIPTHNNSAGVGSLIESINRFPPKYVYEIIVVSNYFDKDLKKDISCFNYTKYLYVGALGVNKARNLGLNNSNFPYVYFFDDDCTIDDQNFFEILVDKIQNRVLPVSILGGVYRNYPTASPISSAYIELQNQWLRSGKVNSKNGSAFLLGGNCGGTKSVFLELVFDDTIIYGGSETELFLRAYFQGVNIYMFDDLVVTHRTKLNLIQLINKARKQARGRLYFEGKGFVFEPIFATVETKDKEINRHVIIKKIYNMFFQIEYSLVSHNSIKTIFNKYLKSISSKINNYWKNYFLRASNLLEIVLRIKK